MREKKEKTNVAQLTLAIPIPPARAPNQFPGRASTHSKPKLRAHLENGLRVGAGSSPTPSDPIRGELSDEA